MHLGKRGRGINRILTILALAWAFGLGGCSQPAETPSATAAPAGSEPEAATTSTAAAALPAAVRPEATPEAKGKGTFAPSQEEQQVVMRGKEGEVTMWDLREYALSGMLEPLKDVGLTTSTALRLDGKTLEAVGQWIGARQAAVAEVKAKNDPKLNAYLNSDVQRHLDNVLSAYMLKNEILDRVPKMTEEEIGNYYEKIKPMLVQPYMFTIRMLLLQTYDNYIVQAGDSLEKIAEQVAGDAKAADNIRADVTGRPLRRDPNKMFKPLAPGEKLLVPMSKERMAEVRGRLEAMLKDVAATTDTHERELKFAVLAKKYDESGLKGETTAPLPTGTKQNKAPLTEIMKAVEATTTGQVSPIFQTKHGYQVLMVMDKEPTHTLPLSHPEVQALIQEKLGEERVKKVAENAIGSLLDNPELKVDNALIARGNTLSTETVVITLGQEKMRWNELKESWAQAKSPRDPIRIRKWLGTFQPLITILFREHLRPVAEDPKSELAHQLAIVRTAYIGTAYIVKLAAEEAIAKINGDKQMPVNFYEKNKEKLFKTAEMASFALATWPLPASQRGLKDQERQRALEELLVKAKADMQPIATAEDFMSLKARLDEGMVSQGMEPMRVEGAMAMSSLPEDIRTAIGKTAPGKWSEPFLTTDKMGAMSVLVKQIQPAGYEPYEKVKAQVNLELYKQVSEPIVKRHENEFAKRAQMELLVKEVELKPRQ